MKPSNLLAIGTGILIGNAVLLAVMGQEVSAFTLTSARIQIGMAIGLITFGIVWAMKEIEQ